MLSLNYLIFNILFLINCELGIFFLAFERAQDYLNTNLEMIQKDLVTEMSRALDQAKMNELIYNITKQREIKSNFENKITEFNDDIFNSNHSPNLRAAMVFKCKLNLSKCNQQTHPLYKNNQSKLSTMSNSLYASLFYLDVKESIKEAQVHISFLYSKFNNNIPKIEKAFNLVEAMTDEMAIIYEKQMSVYEKASFITKLFKFYEYFHLKSIRKINKSFLKINDSFTNISQRILEMRKYVNFYKVLLKRINKYYRLFENKNKELIVFGS